jgi:hypothetical protein
MDNAGGIPKLAGHAPGVAGLRKAVGGVTVAQPIGFPFHRLLRGHVFLRIGFNGSCGGNGWLLFVEVD